ncbi:MAG: alpha/beta fold hydrolase [Propionibacteriaceae bacterium]|nr:alpha/beta fold hydrolase [Propionibacteriaceae bacterium]
MPGTLRRAATALALLLSLIVLPTVPAEAADATTARERARVDRVPTPHLDWEPCDQGQCARVRLPLDYDEPAGATVEVALARVPARKPSERIGSLFLNPGGPGASATDFLQRAQAWLGPDVLDRFDLVGMDPRGTNDSTNTRCFADPGDLDRVTGTLAGMVFPLTRAEEATFIDAASTLSAACSGYGRELSSAVSTAEVARDMDVVRRAVGDDKLSYLGFSYGTYLGQVYANMFPDRVRAIAIDGVINPLQWVGTPGTAQFPMSLRMESAEASSAALAGLLRRCADAGSACPLAHPRADFADVAARLRAEPLVLEDPDAGTYELTYQQFISTVLYLLYTEDGVEAVPVLVATVAQLQGDSLTSSRRRSLSAAYHRTAALAVGQERAYANDLEVVPSVMCSDSRNPARPSTWSRLARLADARAPYFGRSWLWGSVSCADRIWNADDEDAWSGPFDRWTSAPVLVVGNVHDPATNYAGARAVSRLLPNSRLLSSNNWGHTAYGVSGCATAHVDAYLVEGTLPAPGTVCTDGRQPFAG